MSQYEVLRPIEMQGRQLQPGEIVDADGPGWRQRNVDALVENKRLRRLTMAPAPDGLEWQLVPTGTTKPGKAGKEK